MLGLWEEDVTQRKWGFPQAQGGAAREAEGSEQTRMLRKLPITQSSSQQGLYLTKTRWGRDCGHPAGPLWAAAIRAMWWAGKLLEGVLE